ncbi:MAG: potassium channel family protein [Planctomycetota bacterium]|jgi:hypothetical protein
MMVLAENTASGPGRTFLAVGRYRFSFLLAALTLLMLATPILHLLAPGSHWILAQIVVLILFTVMLLSAIVAVSESRLTGIIAVSLALPAISLQCVNVALEHKGFEIARHLSGILFLGYVVWGVLRHLFTRERVTVDLIFASLCVYLLLGVLWSLAYATMELLDPGSFVFALAEEQGGGAMRLGDEQSVFPLYYSLVTMTTLGYGDVIPASSVARMFAAVQAMVGQLYLAVLVARLVGMHIADSTSGRSGDGGSVEGGPAIAGSAI